MLLCAAAGNRDQSDSRGVGRAYQEVIARLLCVILLQTTNHTQGEGVSTNAELERESEAGIQPPSTGGFRDLELDSARQFTCF